MFAYGKQQIYEKKQDLCFQDTDQSINQSTNATMMARHFFSSLRLHRGRPDQTTRKKNQRKNEKYFDFRLFPRPHLTHKINIQKKKMQPFFFKNTILNLYVNVNYYYHHSVVN